MIRRQIVFYDVNWVEKDRYEDNRIVTDVSFSASINNWPSDFDLDLFTSEFDIKQGYLVKYFLFDNFKKSWRLVYFWFVDNVTQSREYREDKKTEKVIVTILHIKNKLDKIVFRSSSNSFIPTGEVDSESYQFMFETIIDAFNAKLPWLLSTWVLYWPATDRIDFWNTNCFQALNKVINNTLYTRDINGAWQIRLVKTLSSQDTIDTWLLIETDDWLLQHPFWFSVRDVKEWSEAIRIDNTWRSNYDSVNMVYVKRIWIEVIVTPEWNIENKIPQVEIVEDTTSISQNWLSEAVLDLSSNINFFDFTAWQWLAIQRWQEYIDKTKNSWSIVNITLTNIYDFWRLRPWDILRIKNTQNTYNNLVIFKIIYKKNIAEIQCNNIVSVSNTVNWQ